MEKTEIKPGVFEYRVSIKLKKALSIEIIDDIAHHYEIGGKDMDNEIQIRTTAESEEAAEEKFSLVKHRLEGLGYI